MAIDPNDLSALKTELTTDPAGLGYTGDDVGDADLLNEVRATIQLYREAIPTYEVYAQVAWEDDFYGLTAAKQDAFALITSTRFMDSRSSYIRDAVQSIFSGTTGGTLGRLNGILQRDASRAEQLFGHGTHVTPSDCADARRQP